MTRAADILQLLLARRPDKLILERKTGLPYGWGIWLRALSPLPRPFHGGDVVAVMLQRPRPPASGVLPELGMWRAFRRLWWQDWDPPPRDQRWMRWTAAACSFLVHLLFALLLLWVALVRLATPPQPAGGGDNRVQVEFLGAGAPAAAAETGGGSPEQVEAPAPGAPRQATASATVPAEPAPAPAAAQMPAPAAPAPSAAVDAAAPAEQPLQVTETSEPTGEFVLPPPTVRMPSVTPRELPTRDMQVRERQVQIVDERPPALQIHERPLLPQSIEAPTVQVREREIQVVDERPPALQVREHPVPPQSIEVPVVQVREREIQIVDERPPAPQVRERPVLPQSIEAPVVQVREREIEVAPSPPLALPQPRGREVEARVRTPELAVREMQVPATEVGTAVLPAPSPAVVPGSAATPPAAAAAPAAAAVASTGQEVASRSQEPAAGDWSAPTHGDDWSAAARDRGGDSARQGEGVYNRDGSVRLPGQDGDAGENRRGAPGGDSDTWTRDRIAASGTWLKRPPYDHAPTSFDRYWVPNESLLAEWVRKGIKNIEIPIPGTNTRISCVVSLLQFGGGCGLSNPNMNEQPAEARPPPDVPFKPELQEDNGSR